MTANWSWLKQRVDFDAVQDEHARRLALRSVTR